MTQNEINNVILVADDTSANMGEAICQKMSLGQPLTDGIHLLYLLQNCLNGITKGTNADYTDDNYTYIAELINRIATQSIKH